MPAPFPSSSASNTAAALQTLAALGRMLDAQELGRIALVPSQYRQAAAWAGSLLAQLDGCLDTSEVADVVALSPALGELWLSRTLELTEARSVLHATLR